jgi:uncharacterized membrane protein YcaP (DUF421 family)
MESVLRAAAVYLFLLVIFRISGKRSLSQITTFDFVFLLIVGESTQQALLSTDFSVINAFVVIATMVVLEHGFSRIKHRWQAIDRALEGLPLILIDNGQVLESRMDREQIDLSDVLAAARESQGAGGLEDIQSAVLARSGGISIILRQPARG